MQRHLLIALLLSQALCVPAFAETDESALTVPTEITAEEFAAEDINATGQEATEESLAAADTAESETLAATEDAVSLEATESQTAETEMTEEAPAEIAALPTEEEAVPTDATEAQTAEISTDENDNFVEMSSMDSSELDNTRGAGFEGDTIQVSAQNASVSGSATGNISGNNSISDQAFSGMSGIGVSMQNSGNNVVMQNTIQVNVVNK